MENIFERKISVWKNTTRNANNKCEVTLMQFLDAGSYYLPTINYLRQVYDAMMLSYSTDIAASVHYEEEYKSGKKSLPLATIGGTFANGGLREDMLRPSNLICLDIDTTKPRKAAQLIAEGKEVPNGWVTDWQAPKRKLSLLPFVAYCGLSVGGHGLFLIIPIEDYHHHTEAWGSLNYLFGKHLHLTIDPQTKDITRPRFVSFDPSPYINPSAEVFRAVLPQPTTPMRSYSFSHTHTHGSTEEAILTCVEEIERRRVDITQNYADWIDIASALYNELGEDGKQYFLRVSIFYPYANEKEIEYKWRANQSRSGIGIGTFFRICANYGIHYHTSERHNSPPQQAKPVEVSMPDDTSLYSKIYNEMEQPQLPPDFFATKTGTPPF